MLCRTSDADCRKVTMLSLVLYMLAVHCYHLFYLAHIMDVVVVVA